jgi:hypothetical protein
MATRSRRFELVCPHVDRRRIRGAVEGVRTIVAADWRHNWLLPTEETPDEFGHGVYELQWTGVEVGATRRRSKDLGTDLILETTLGPMRRRPWGSFPRASMNTLAFGFSDIGFVDFE